MCFFSWWLIFSWQPLFISFISFPIAYSLLMVLLILRRVFSTDYMVLKMISLYWYHHFYFSMSCFSLYQLQECHLDLQCRLQVAFSDFLSLVLSLLPLITMINSPYIQRNRIRKKLKTFVLWGAIPFFHFVLLFNDVLEKVLSKVSLILWNLWTQIIDPYLFLFSWFVREKRAKPYCL